MRAVSRSIRSALTAWLLCSSLAGPAMAQTPGVNVAAPRVAESKVDDDELVPRFTPADLAVEQGEWASWVHIGTFVIHTTTHGANCTPASPLLWDSFLFPGTRFTRKFSEPPRTILYYCEPHCFLGMTGTLTVTTPILLRTSQPSDSLQLDWSGGSGHYAVFRSDHPGFVSAATQKFTPTEGSTGTSFTDAATPDRGRVFFYLVANEQGIPPA